MVGVFLDGKFLMSRNCYIVLVLLLLCIKNRNYSKEIIKDKVDFYRKIFNDSLSIFIFRKPMRTNFSDARPLWVTMRSHVPNGFSKSFVGDV